MPARSGVLFLALAGIGSTGCITTAVVNNIQYQNRLREQAAARQRHIAELEPIAAAGDARARVALANELLSSLDRDARDLRRALALLEQAVAQDYGPAQGRLGEILADGRAGNGSLPVDLRDRERGIVLLQRAFALGCSAASNGTVGGLDPAWKAGLALAAAGHPEQALVWRARSILGCHSSRPGFLFWDATSRDTAPAQRTDTFAILLLTRDEHVIAKARAAVPADEFAAAERRAADLERQIADSERDYPAPPRKEQP
ncbi:MAG: sel1 repeat family protein [Massilia sp.]|nr:sel1 repeat family protein [Massilia sp.]